MLQALISIFCPVSVRIGRHRTRKKNCEPGRGLQRIIVSKIKNKAYVGEGGERERELHDAFGIRYNGTMRKEI